MVKNISKEEIFNYLAAEEIFPGTNGHEKAVRETIYFLLGTSEGKAPDDLVDKVVQAAQTYHYKSFELWRKNYHKEDRFRNNLTKPGRFLSNSISIPGSDMKKRALLNLKPISPGNFRNPILFL